MTPSFLKDFELAKFDFRGFCREAYFYISQERKYMQALVNSCGLLQNYLKGYCEKAEKQLQVLKRLNMPIGAEETKKTAIEDKQMPEFEVCMKKISTIHEKCENLKKHQSAWLSLSKEVNSLFDNYSKNNAQRDAQRLFNHLNGPAEELKKRIQKNIITVVLDVIKQRDTVLNSTEFNTFCRY